MNKCLVVTFLADIPKGFLQNQVLKYAKKLSVEGTAQILSTENKVRIIVCGSKERVDSFLDFIHKGIGTWSPQNLEIEPFLKDKEYRGVFRIIE